MERWRMVFFQNGMSGIGGPAKLIEFEAKDWRDAKQKARNIFRGDFKPGDTLCPYHNQDIYLINMILVSELHDSSGDLLKTWQEEIELEEEAFDRSDLPEPLLAVCQPWVFRERGSAPEYDKHSLHIDEDERDRYEREYIKENHPPGRAPDCYSQPEGAAFLVEVDKVTYLKLRRKRSLMVYERPPKPFELRSRRSA
jgi:hypothetical protein